MYRGIAVVAVPAALVPAVEVAILLERVQRAVAVVVDTVAQQLGGEGADRRIAVVTVPVALAQAVGVVVGLVLVPCAVAVVVQAVAGDLDRRRGDGGVLVVAVPIVLGEAVAVVVHRVRIERPDGRGPDLLHVVDTPVEADDPLIGPPQSTVHGDDGVGEPGIRSRPHGDLVHTGRDLGDGRGHAVDVVELHPEHVGRKARREGDAQHDPGGRRRPYLVTCHAQRQAEGAEGAQDHRNLRAAGREGVSRRQRVVDGHAVEGGPLLEHDAGEPARVRQALVRVLVADHPGEGVVEVRAADEPQGVPVRGEGLVHRALLLRPRPDGIVGVHVGHGA